MSDVFVSYSRRDAAFVGRLSAALRERGKDVWVDVEGIRDSEVFPTALRVAIEASNAFVFVITPDSVASPHCTQEVELALAHNKRIVPMVLRPVEDANAIPGPIRERNWIPFETDDLFERGVERVVTAIDTDLEWAREHTRWLMKALEWDSEGRDASFLLRGAELASAERWIGSAAGKEPAPTDLQREYVDASRAESSRRLRRFAAASLLVAALSVGLLVFALIQWDTAREERDTASRLQRAALTDSLAAGVDAELESGEDELAALLARLAYQLDAEGDERPEVDAALREVLDARPFTHVLAGHTAAVTGIDVRPEGTQIASVAGGAASPPDATVRLWTIGGGETRMLTGHTDRATSIAYAPDGMRLASASADGTVRIWDADRGTTVQTLELGTPLLRIVWRLDDTLVAADEEGGVRVVAPDGTAIAPRLEGHDGPAQALAASPAWLASGGADGVIRVHDSAGRTHELPATNGAPVLALAFAQDGHTLASSRLQDRIRIWDLRRPGAPPLALRLPGENSAQALAFIGDRRLAAGVDDNRIRIYDLRQPNAPPDVLTGHTQVVNTVTSADHGRHLISGANDRSVRVWELAEDETFRRRLVGHEAGVLALAYTANGSRIASADDDGIIRVWGNGKPLVLQPDAPDGELEGLAVSPDGRRLAAGGEAGTLRVWALDRPRATVVARSSHGDEIQAADYGPDGDSLAWVVKDGTIHVRSAADLNAPGPTFRIDSEPEDLDFSPDGRLLAVGSDDHVVRIWNLEQAGARPLVLRAHDDFVRAVEFSPDGHSLITSSGDTTIRIWDLSSSPPTVSAVLRGHADSVEELAISPDSSVLASASDDRTVRVWDLDTPDRLPLVISAATEVEAVAFAPDGDSITYAGDEGTVFVDRWRTEELAELVCELVWRDIRPDEWLEFVGPSPPQRPVC